MSESIWRLRLEGYDVFWTGGRYCRAILGDRELLLRWTGDEWVQI